MRFLKLGLVFLVVLALAVLLAVNMRSEVTLVLDPLGLGYDVLRQRTVTLPWFLLVLVAAGLFMGSILENVRARKVRRELREKRDEATLLRAELHRVKQSLRSADTPEAAAALLTRR